MTQDAEQLSVDLKNEMVKLEQNLAKLEDVQKRLIFILREVSYLMKVQVPTENGEKNGE